MNALVLDFPGSNSVLTKTFWARYAAGPPDMAVLAVEPGFRGCAFVNAAVERADPSDSIHQLVARHKAWIAGEFEAIARAANWPRPGLLARQLIRTC